MGTMLLVLVLWGLLLAGFYAGILALELAWQAWRARKRSS